MKEGQLLPEQIAHQEVANSLNEWYGAILKRDKWTATQLRKEIEDSLPYMTKNQNILLYFNLIESRHKLLMEEYDDSGKILGNIETIKALEQVTDEVIQYYYYFFSGVYEFYQKKYIQAIRFYRQAEAIIDKIPDEIEVAEFHYQLAMAYYRIDQHFFSINHAEQALQLFKCQQGYVEKEIYCEMIIGANKLDMRNYTECEKHYQNALRKSIQAEFTFSESLAYFNLGLCYGRQHLYPTSAEYFKMALSIHEHKSSTVGMKSMFELAHVLYKDEKFEEAQEWHKKGLYEAEKGGEEEYKAKFIFIDGLYNTKDALSMELALDHLEDQKLWTDVAELTLDAAFHHKKKGDTLLSSHYFEKAHYARDQIIRLMEGLN